MEDEKLEDRYRTIISPQ